MIKPRVLCGAAALMFLCLVGACTPKDSPGLKTQDDVSKARVDGFSRYELSTPAVARASQTASAEATDPTSEVAAAEPVDPPAEVAPVEDPPATEVKPPAPPRVETRRLPPPRPPADAKAKYDRQTWTSGSDPKGKFAPPKPVSWAVFEDSCRSRAVAFFPAYFKVFTDTSEKKKKELEQWHPRPKIELAAAFLNLGKSYDIFVSFCTPAFGTEGALRGAACMVDNQNPTPCFGPFGGDRRRGAWLPFIYLTVTAFRSRDARDPVLYQITGIAQRDLPNALMDMGAKTGFMPDSVRTRATFNHELDISGSLSVETRRLPDGNFPAGFAGRILTAHPKEHPMWALVFETKPDSAGIPLRAPSDVPRAVMMPALLPLAASVSQR